MSTGEGITYAHRWVWQQINGPVPDGFEVCHNCPNGDNPSCCRPSHLWLGTHAQNIQDSYAKGRSHGNRANHAKGDDHWNARLSSEDVYRIRRLADAGSSHAELAREYKMTRMTIGQIARRKTWRSLPEED